MAARFALIFFVMVPALIAGSGPLYPDVTILSSDANSITLEVRPRFGADRIVTAASNAIYRVPTFTFESASPDNRPGREDLRVRVVPLAVPSYVGNTVSVIASDMENIASYPLAPVSSIGSFGEEGTVERVYEKGRSSLSGFQPANVAWFGPVSTVKGVRMGNLFLAPFQFDAATSALRRYSRIVVRIDYGTPQPAVANSGDDNWARTALLNYSALSSWNSTSRPARSAPINSVLSSGTWVKVEVAEDGLYKLDAAYLRSIGIDPVGKSITDINVFGGDGRALPENLNIARPSDVPQVAVDYVDRNSNGTFDADDMVIFYGQGVNGWTYDPVQKQFNHYGNPYLVSNFYFVTTGTSAAPRVMASVNVAPQSSALRTVRGRAVFDEDKFNFDQSGQEWVSAPINPGESRTVSTKLTGYVPGTSISYQYQLYARSTDNTTMSIEETGLSLGLAEFFPIDFASYLGYASEVRGSATVVPSLADQRSMVKFKYNTSNSASTAFIGWLRIFYRQQLTASGDQLSFVGPDSSALVTFDVDGFTRNDISVYEVSSVNAVRKIQYQLQQPSGTLLMSDSAAAGKVRRYMLCTADQFKTPRSAVRIPNSNLHALTGAEFVIITHSDFKNEALRLKKHKESLPGKRRISTVVVDVDTIFNEFGQGMADPTAMRDFLRYAMTQWTVKPKYLLLFGDASYDYRNILRIDRNWVPTYQTAEVNVQISSYAIEDYFTYLDPADQTSVSLAAGRLTPRTNADAAWIVDKIINYETALPPGPWKNLVTLVADDLWTPGNTNESDHVLQTETMATMSVAYGMDIRRIYMEEYPTVFASTGRRKPTVRADILDAVNGTGTVMMNYVGHGNPKVWAHENVLTQDDVRNQFVNGNKLIFIVAATCDWGRFDEAGESSSAEDVVFNRSGGAIGVLSANRAVFSAENALTNQRFYEYMLNANPVQRLGDAYMLMKNSMVGFFYLENKQKYFLLGDPTMTLAVPSGSVTVDSIATLAGAKADTLHALEKIVVKATIRDTANAVASSFSGRAILTVNDAQFTKTIPTVLGLTYEQNGSVIYTGQATVTNGNVSASFIVPKDISYTNRNGRISLYFWNNETDGRGYSKNFVVGGTSANAPKDSVGPEITIYFDDPSFRSGDLVSENPVLYVALKDSNGINSSSQSIGHRMEAWIDGSAKSIDLTGYYLGKTDSYKEGEAKYALTGLAPGNHSIAVRAWDVYNNSSMTDARFMVASSASLSIEQLFNFPNPVSTRTAFTFQHNQSLPIDVTIRIYTVAGRLIQTIERQGIQDRFVKIDWDRTDKDGSEVGNGLYFYKVNARTIDGRFSSEAIGKMAVIR